MKMTPASEIKPPPETHVKIDWEARTIDIHGGGGVYTEEDPYWIAFERVGNLREIVDWMAHLAGKSWARHGAHKIGRALVEVHESERSAVDRLADLADAKPG
ncbi:MAG TPA: hypothetical protein VMW52_06015 [Phycisphaerae bacterium]|nr:hypothetical protein [Phycisphaerae bacterium]